MIDSHIHVVPPGLPGVGSLSPLLEWPHEARALALRQEMIAAGVDQVFAMGCWNSGAQDPLGVVATLQMARTVPGLHAVGIADPTRTEPEHLGAVADVLATGHVK